jgi:hypothetical protein
MPPLDALLAGVGGWARALETAESEPLRRALAVLIERVEPVRIKHGTYEASLSWTPIGLALLGLAVKLAPTENLLGVDYSGRTA